jgi:hypothetical protein
MLSQILSRVRTLLADGARLPAVPATVASIALEGNASLGDYLDLDDAVLWSSIAGWRGVSDPVLRDLTTRLYSRRLFKTYELFAELGEPAARLEALDTARGIAREAGLDPEIYVGLDVASDVPFDDANEPFDRGFPRRQRAPAGRRFLPVAPPARRTRGTRAADLRRRAARADPPGHPRMSFRAAVIRSLAVAIVSSFAAEARAQVRDDDGVYGRFLGDLELGLGLGADLGSPTRGAVRGSLHYYSMAGVYAGYGDAFAESDDGNRRLLGFGVDLRPAFIPRWARNMQQGPAFVDLFIDSIGLGVGAFWAQPPGRDFGRERGFELSLGAGLPLLGTAPGPWLEARGNLRWSAGETAEPSLLVLLSWHAFVLTPLTDN